MKTTITEEQLKKDVMDFCTWKTIKFINKYFDNNYQEFYEVFQKFKHLKSLSASVFKSTWKNIRTINNFMGIDCKKAKSLCNKKMHIFADLEKAGLIHSFNYGTLCWNNANKEVGRQNYCKKYIIDIKLAESIFNDKKRLESVLSFKKSDFSTRVLKFIKKHFPNKQDNDDIDARIHQNQHLNDIIDVDEQRRIDDLEI